MTTSTEQKIREAYEQAVANDPYVASLHSFKAGWLSSYLALLNELVECGSINDMGAEKLYRLPDGVTRD